MAASHLEKIQLFEKYETSVLSRSTYQILDTMTFGFAVLNWALLSGFAFRVAMFILAAHSLMHVLTDFEGHGSFLQQKSWMKMSLGMHAAGDFLIALSYGYIGFGLDASMGCTQWGATVYRVLFLASLLSAPLTLPRAFQRDAPAKCLVVGVASK
eukprot:gb/GFBE01074384.1/.p1 GENE.gb/GFBE01074384.1/~~gb/GFBE01074384.1/.p1  ORF type:complete len:155 (+),score=29.75 gb/GFBE01074384.1/:1-465(+)